MRGHLIRLTLPMIWGILALISNSVVDTFFVATLGTDALSALSFSFPVMLTVTSLSIGLGAGASSVVSRGIGRGDHAIARRRSTDALILSFALVTALALVGVATVRPLFTLLGAHGNVLDLIERYMSIWFLGLPLVVVPMVGNSLIRAAGDARIPGLIMVGGAFTNMVLDPLLIFGLLGLPRLEVAGAALATVIANGTTLAVSLWVLHFRERMLAWELPPLRVFLESCRKVLSIGLPAAAANMINPIGVAMITALLAQFGQETVAGYGLATRIEALAGVGLLALSASIGPIVGQNLGARKFDRVHLALRRGFQFCIIYGLAMAALVALLAFPLTALFTDSQVVSATANAYLWIVPATALGYGINIVGAAALNAVGRPLLAAALTFTRMMVLLVPAAHLLGHFHGHAGVFWAVAGANLAAGAITVKTAHAAARRLESRAAVMGPAVR